MLQQRFEVPWVVKLCGVDHCVVVAELAAVDLLVPARVRIGTIFKQRDEAFEVACAKRPGQKWNSVIGREDHVGINPIVFHEVSDSVLVSALCGNGEFQSVTSEVVASTVSR